jgi:signal transduction histidine kinase
VISDVPSSLRAGRLEALFIAVAAAETPLQVAGALMQHGLTILKASAGGMLLVREDGLILESLLAVGYPHDVLAAWEWIPLAMATPAAEAVRTRGPIWIGSWMAVQMRYPQLAESLSRVGTRAIAALPLLVGSNALAVLLLTFEEERVFGSEERHFAESLIHSLAPALDRARRSVEPRPVQTDAPELTRRRNERILHASHDVKMPITAIKMACQLLGRRLEGRRDPQLRMVIAELEHVDAAVTRIGELVDELVALAGGASDIGLTRGMMDLVALIRRVAGQAQSGQAVSRISVESETTRLIGHWDARQLERVFTNLFDNALKYSQATSPVQVTVTVEGAADLRWAVVRIHDRGLGIPVADLPHVFESHQRGANVVDHIPGTGVGLASARDIVEKHGGSIRVVSEMGQGSTFTVRLPLGEPAYAVSNSSTTNLSTTR